MENIRGKLQTKIKNDHQRQINGKTTPGVIDLPSLQATNKQRKVGPLGLKSGEERIQTTSM